MAVLGIIPARLSSTRLPGKLLLKETGKTLIQHTWESACRASVLDEIAIATDSPEIAEVSRDFGAQVIETGECANGTERVAKALEQLARQGKSEFEIVVNVQGDEPEIDPEQINICVESLKRNPNCEMSTLANPILSLQQLQSPSCVKVVMATNGHALYFSRSPIPYSRDLPAEIWFSDPPAYQSPPWLQHIGLYAYRVPFLKAFVEMPPSSLEQIEQLEQLRALQAGASIHVSVVHHRAAGIDTPEDYEQFVQRFRSL